MLKEKRTVFKGGAVEKALSKMSGKEIDSFGEALRNVTYNLLETGDAPFVKSAFVDSLSQYCAAKGITSADGVTADAVEFATANAMEATFKNANAIADLVNRVKRNTSTGVSAAIDIENFFNTLLNPTNVTRGSRNAVDDEIYRLIDSTGGKSFIPSVSPYKVEHGNKEYTMSGKERETFQKVQGQTYYELAEPLLKSEMYKALDDDQKAETLKAIRDYALDEAKRQFVEGKNAEYSSDLDKVQDLSDKANYFAAKQAFSSAKKSDASTETYNALDTALKYWDKLSNKSKETLLDQGNLHVPSLVYASRLGQSSETWYSNKAAIDKNAAKLGSTDAATAISVYNNMHGRGKPDKEILTAIKSQILPERGGAQNSTVRKLEAYMTAAEKNGYEANLGEWLNLVANVADADENGGSPSRKNVDDGWAALGLGENDTYAGIDLTTAYNIMKTGAKSYALNPEYAAQTDNIFAGILPAREKTKAKLGGSVMGVAKSEPNSESVMRAWGLS